MASRIMLHVGAPKTGTTYLQAVLFHNRDRLRDDGVLVPGLSRTDHGQAATGVRQGPGGKRYGDWKRLVAAAKSWSGTVVISNEWFAMATAEHARSALDDLAGVADAETHVVFTARDFVEQIPAAWQETLKLGVSSSLEEFTGSLDATQGRWRWSVLDPAEVLERWRGDLPPGRLHVVTLPPKGSDSGLLWQRFARVCGIDPDSCDTSLDQARESVGVESARLLQLAGPALRDAIGADDGPWHEPYRWIQRYLSHEVLAPLGGGRIGLGQGELDALRARSRQTVETLAAQGYDVVGDLADLTAAQPPESARHPHNVPARDVLEVAVPVVAELLGRVRTETLRADEAEEQLEKLRSSTTQQGSRGGPGGAGCESGSAAGSDESRTQATRSEATSSRQPASANTTGRGMQLRPLTRRVRALYRRAVQRPR